MQNVTLNAFTVPLLAQQTQSGGGASMFPLIAMVLMFGALYFLMLAPQRKKQKEHQKMITALASGDEVLTSGGIYGTITNVKNDRLVLRIGDGTKVEVSRAFVHSLEKKASAS